MSDGFSATVVDTVTPALERLGDAALKHTVPASRVSAESIAREARRRVARDTGQTAQGIGTEMLKNRTGYVVYSVNQRMPNLPLWIEAGTRKGKPHSRTEQAQPYFYPAVRLEESAHERRILEAIDKAIVEVGL